MNKRSKAMNSSQPWAFTCKTCGGHDLTVTHTWNILTGNDSETWQEWVPLKADHLWQYNYKEKIDKTDEDGEVKRGDFGEFAENDSDSEPQEYEALEQESDPESDEFYVNCANCDREIEFGWAETNRSGGIFPIECSDFMPEKFFPEPRYFDSWQKKGWLQRADDHAGK
jgi:hypothetical protein